MDEFCGLWVTRLNVVFRFCEALQNKDGTTSPPTCLPAAPRSRLRSADFFSPTPEGGCQLDACVEAPDGIEGNYALLGGCRRCNAERTACLQCHSFFGLSSDGRCSLVRVGGGGVADLHP